jgi:glycosyltransferase
LTFVSALREFRLSGSDNIKMKISVITPTFNSEKTILRNAESVLNQTYKNFEHIVVDNLSSDGTVDLIKECYSRYSCAGKLKIISEKDEGISDAFNKGIKASAGEIIAILNSDDLYYHNEVFSEVAGIMENEKILFVHGNLYFVDPVYGTNIRQPLPDKNIRALQYNHQTMFIKKKLYDKIGLYNINFYISMDYEFYCRLSKYDPENISIYLHEKPLVMMMAGGISWKNELQSVQEIKKAMQLHGYWNFEGKKFYYLRKTRVRAKKILTLLGFQSLIRIWRNLKWG